MTLLFVPFPSESFLALEDGTPISSLKHLTPVSQYGIFSFNLHNTLEAVSQDSQHRTQFTQIAVPSHLLAIYCHSLLSTLISHSDASSCSHLSTPLSHSLLHSHLMFRYLPPSQTFSSPLQPHVLLLPVPVSPPHSLSSPLLSLIQIPPVPVSLPHSLSFPLSSESVSHSNTSHSRFSTLLSLFFISISRCLISPIRRWISIDSYVVKAESRAVISDSSFQMADSLKVMQDSQISKEDSRSQNLILENSVVSLFYATSRKFNSKHCFVGYNSTFYPIRQVDFGRSPQRWLHS